MRNVRRTLSALLFVRMIDVRRAAMTASWRGAISFSTTHREFRIRVPFWKVRATRRAVRESIPVTTACRVGALSLRDHFRVRAFCIHPAA